MRRRDENFMTMVSTTLELLNANKPKWEGKPAIAALVADIMDGQTAISGARQGAGSAVSTGTTMDKDAAEANAIDTAMMLAGYAMTYARKTGNNELREQMKAVKRKDLEDTDDTALPDALLDLHTRLAKLGKPVEDYGIDDTSLGAFQDDIDAYKKLMNAPRTVIVTRKGINSTRPAILKELREDLKDLDRLMEVFAKSDPQFLTDYRNARIIIDRGGGQGGDDGAGGGTPQHFPGS